METAGFVGTTFARFRRFLSECLIHLFVQRTVHTLQRKQLQCIRLCVNKVGTGAKIDSDGRNRKSKHLKRKCTEHFLTTATASLAFNSFSNFLMRVQGTGIIMIFPVQFFEKQKSVSIPVF